jgi:glycine cleavage system aminomethyltransferase T
LNGNEYDPQHIPTNCPLFGAAIDMTKEQFIGKKALKRDAGNNKRMVLFITEGIVVGRGIYRNGKRLGTATSSINSPNVSQEKWLNAPPKKAIIATAKIAKITN